MMRNIMKSISKRSSIGILLFALLTVMILSANVHKAWAYFTTYATAKGGYTIHLGDTTTTNEEFKAWQKHVTITSGKDSQPVFVRAAAFCGSAYSLDYSGSSSKWSSGEDGYYYYSDILNAEESAEELVITIGDIPEDVTDPSDFNVVVVYETTPVLYDSDGNAYADWNGKVEAATVSADD